jgi:hypothetical protein
MALEFPSYSLDFSLPYFYLFPGQRTVLKGQCSQKPRELLQKLQDHWQVIKNDFLKLYERFWNISKFCVNMCLWQVLDKHLGKKVWAIHGCLNGMLGSGAG